jgi:hypothetical protein
MNKTIFFSGDLMMNFSRHNQDIPPPTATRLPPRSALQFNLKQTKPEFLLLQRVMAVKSMSAVIWNTTRSHLTVNTAVI